MDAPHCDSLDGLVGVLGELEVALPLHDLRDAALHRRVQEVVERVSGEEVRSSEKQKSLDNFVLST